MPTSFTFESFHEALVAELFTDRLDDDDAMLLFALLHTHKINLVEGAVSDSPDLRCFLAMTQRHCAMCLANLWRDLDDVRNHYVHWYDKWAREWSYERVDALSGSQLRRFTEMKRRVEAHPLVESIELEED